MFTQSKTSQQIHCDVCTIAWTIHSIRMFERTDKSKRRSTSTRNIAKRRQTSPLSTVEEAHPSDVTARGGSIPWYVTCLQFGRGERIRYDGDGAPGGSGRGESRWAAWSPGRPKIRLRFPSRVPTCGPSCQQFTVMNE